MLTCDGNVTTLCACAFVNTMPSAASRSRNGVFTRVLPEYPTASARSVSIVTRMTSGLPCSAFGGAEGSRWQARIETAASAREKRRIDRAKDTCARKRGSDFVRSTLECGGKATALGGRWNRDEPQHVMLATSSRCVT